MAQRVIPLARCVARPPEGGRAHPLIDHLLDVACRAGDPRGSAEEQLLFLAGLLHDVGKARRTWQERLLDPKRKGPVGPHAFVGAALFAALALRWSQGTSARSRVEMARGTGTIGGPPSTGGFMERALAVARDIADHHGTLGDLETDTPWHALWTPQIVAEMDMEGILRLVRETGLPVANGVWPRDGWEWEKWVRDARGAWGRAVVRLQRRSQGTAIDPRGLLRDHTARLIQADRFAVAGVVPENLDAKQAEEAITRLELSLGMSHGSSGSPSSLGRGPDAEGQRGGITGERRRLQQEVLARFRRHPQAPLYLLVLPTGSGKTLTAFRVALEACARGARQRVVYVGPYLTVVEQAAGQFQRHTGLAVMQHHHLAIPESQVPNGGNDGDPLPSDDERAFLLMESWQAPVVAVTFHQFFRALFPRRAQHTLRIPALRDAFVILDEPQIMDPGSWALLTEMMAAACRAWNMQVLIMTATMPPWRVRSVEPVDLSVPVRLPSRYRLRVVDHGAETGSDGQGWGPEALAERLVADALSGFRTAAILNTIADAQATYDAVQRLLEERGRRLPVLLVHGLMTPAHKATQVEAVRRATEDRPAAGDQRKAEAARRTRRVYPIVVSTQVLEAGVDLDFDRLYRARPVLPSVVQAAGRANRHGVREPAQVVVFDFRRADGKDSRPWVYRDAIARDETDQILRPGEQWDERALDEAVEAYYRRWWERKPGSDVVGPLAQAAAGAWSAIGGLMPYDEGPPRIPVFVSRDDCLADEDRPLLSEWGVSSLEGLYELYARPGWLAGRRQGERRRFLGLFERYVVQLPLFLARQVAEVVPGRRVLRLVDRDAYDPRTGFGGLRLTVAGDGDEEAFGGRGVDIW